MRVGVDIDDCIFPWYRKAHAVCVAAGITNGKTPTSWDMHENYGCTKQQWIDALSTATEKGFLYSGAPIYRSRQALEQIRAAGHTIHLQTARGFFTNGTLIREATVRWLAEYKIPHDSLTFTKDKTIVGTDIAIDDNPGHAYRLIEAGTLCYLMDAPHNRANDDLVRMYSMEQFADVVIKAGSMLGAYDKRRAA